MMWRLILVSVFFVSLAVLLIFRVHDLTLGYENTRRANHWIMTRSPNSLNELSHRIEELEHLESHVEDYSIGEIQRIIANLLRTMKNVETEINAQYAAWEKFRVIVRTDSQKHKVLSRELEALEKLEESEVKSLHSLIKAAENPLNYSFYLGVLLSFPIGVLSSMSAALVWARMRGREYEL